MNIDQYQLFKRIGEKLKEARNNCGLTQEDVAFMVGLTRTSVTNTESGTQKPSLPALYVYCKVYGVDLSDVLPPLDEIVSGDVVVPQVQNRIAELEHQLKLLKRVQSGSNAR